MDVKPSRHGHWSSESSKNGVASDVEMEYASSLADLTLNSKPLINMLTMLAEDSISEAPVIVKVIEEHLDKVRPAIKLPGLYLIDSILKNVGKEYTTLFTNKIVSIFCSVFGRVDERVRAQMFKLRQTWNDIFPPKKLYALDVRVNSIDPAWPLSSAPPGNIHFNPKFLPNSKTQSSVPPVSAETLVRDQILKKQKEYIEKKKAKVERQIQHTRAMIKQKETKLVRKFKRGYGGSKESQLKKSEEDGTYVETICDAPHLTSEVSSRLLETPGKERSTNSDSDQESRKENLTVDEVHPLFGTQDVDLRKLNAPVSKNLIDLDQRTDNGRKEPETSEITHCSSPHRPKSKRRRVFPPKVEVSEQPQNNYRRTSPVNGYQQKPFTSLMNFTSNVNAPYGVNFNGNSLEYDKLGYARDSVATVNEIPPVDPLLLNQIEMDVTKTVVIDGYFREVRFYGFTAIVLLSADDPREIEFKCGSRNLFVDDSDAFRLIFGDSYKQIVMDGLVSNVKLGSPTRELYIDDQHYECAFGQPFRALLCGKWRKLQIESPSPQVSIRRQKRTDLVAGKVQMKLDNCRVFQLYLDAKPQKFDVEGIPYILRFVEALRTVLINNVPFKIEFGGPPAPFYVRGVKHILELGPLPKGVSPGYIHIANMEGGNLLMLKPMPVLHQPPLTEPNMQDVGDLSQRGAPVGQNESLSLEKPALPENINVGELYEKLAEIGMVPPRKKNKKQSSSIVSSQMDFTKPETLKMRAEDLIKKLYSGVQCSSCGVRFQSRETEKYSRHLDWHFRQNRLERDSNRIRCVQPWFYSRSDWIRYQEIEDPAPKEIFFDTILNQNKEEENVESEPSVPAERGLTALCDICHEQFDQFFHEETEEWHLKNALRKGDKVCHPACLEDLDKDSTTNNHFQDLDKDSTTNSHFPNDSSDDDVVEVDIIEPEVEIIEVTDDDDEIDCSLSVHSVKSGSESPIDFLKITIKKEKIDLLEPVKETVTPTIDGNLVFEEASQIHIPEKIKINISRSLAKNKETNKNPSSEVDSHLVNQVESDDIPLLEPAKIKQKILDNKMTVVNKTVCSSSEVSSLCVIT